MGRSAGVLRHPANSPEANLGELQLRSARVNARSARRVTLPGTPLPHPPAGLARKSLRCNRLESVRRPKCGYLKDLRPKNVQPKDLESSRPGESCQKSEKPRDFVRSLCVSISSVANWSEQNGRFLEKCACFSFKLKRFLGGVPSHLSRAAFGGDWRSLYSRHRRATDLTQADLSRS
jgi:hypothetical protein